MADIEPAALSDTPVLERVPLTHVASEVVADLLARIEADVDRYGWDQPHRLWVIRNVPGSGFAFVQLATDPEAHPLDVLTDRWAPPDVSGLAVCFEGWTYPPDVTADEQQRLAPADHPRRVEMRAITAVLSDGSIASVVRRRGSETLDDTAIGGGRVVAAMQCSLGLLPEVEADATTLLATLWAMAALAAGRVAQPSSAQELHAVVSVTDPALALAGRYGTIPPPPAEMISVGDWAPDELIAAIADAQYQAVAGALGADPETNLHFRWLGAEGVAAEAEALWPSLGDALADLEREFGEMASVLRARLSARGWSE